MKQSTRNLLFGIGFGFLIGLSILVFFFVSGAFANSLCGYGAALIVLSGVFVIWYLACLEELKD